MTHAMPKWVVRRALTVCLTLALGAGYAAAADETVSAVVGAVLKSSSEQMSQKQYAQATATLQAGLQVKGLSEFEKFSHDRLLVGAASGSQAYSVVLDATARVLASPYLKASEKQGVLQARLNAQLNTKLFGGAASTLEQLLKDQAHNLQYLNLRSQAYYFDKQYDKSLMSAKAEWLALEAQQQKPPEDLFKLMADSAQALNNEADYLMALHALVKFYPNADYWSDLIYRSQASGAFKAAGDLHFYRLLQAASAFKDAGEYLDAAEAYIKAGFALEAERVLKLAETLNVLPNKELGTLYSDKRKQVAGLVAQDRQNVSSAKINASNKPKTPEARLAVAYNQVLMGEATTGLVQINQAVLEPTLKSRGLGLLVLAQAQREAAQPDKARETFLQLKQDPQFALLADLWLKLF